MFALPRGDKNVKQRKSYDFPFNLCLFLYQGTLAVDLSLQDLVFLEFRKYSVPWLSQRAMDSRSGSPTL